MSIAHGLRGVSRETLRGRIYVRLRAAIMKGMFEPGQALTVRGLADAFGTSPTPVREALQQLVAENALIAEPNRSYRVPRITQDMFLDIRDTRAELEGLAAQKAALMISAGEIRRLEQLVERMSKAIDGQDLKNYLSANEDFHFAIYEASRSPVLLRIIRALWVQIGPSLNALFQNLELVESLQEHHRAALEAFRARDPMAARRAIRDDILQAGAFIAEQSTTFED
ncbi:GntR family transcriptional regulator [Tepidamorphus gemmatus]|uniref:GntR family transcriptional regulator n=1 Tax=Tepidamorphus gemmatus TaxID=747076 RepID=A0A4R3M8N6_9HYPH|nr:GntR family transcriptional regulator [Tepidamorphus gemmatus]TCT09894.1 GntR family transcriptional regulator [Tepidamorphus gemmatus]